ncbi:MAG: hypothetical protein VKK80_04915 [Prochlorothrix sp.]|nr:hypothetical protein [Prochlorothrix sp.]
MDLANFTPLLMQVEAGAAFPAMTVLTLLVLVGFVAAVGIGSIAWYNSKRPPGWETKDRPSFIPKFGRDDDN